MTTSTNRRFLAIALCTFGATAASWATVSVLAQHDDARARGFAGNGQGSNGFDYPFSAELLNTNVNVAYSDACSWQGNNASATTLLDVRRRIFSGRGMKIDGEITTSCSATGFESVFASGEAKHQLAFSVDRNTAYTAVVTVGNSVNVNGIFNLIGFGGFAIGAGSPQGKYTFSGTLVAGTYYIDYYLSSFMSPGQSNGSIRVSLEVGRVPNQLGS